MSNNKQDNPNQAEVGAFIQAGRYRHYKGPEYQVYGLATHSETEEKMVVYRCLYGEFDVWVRPLSMFQETVEQEGKQVPRFQLVEKSDEASLDFKASDS